MGLKWGAQEPVLTADLIRRHFKYEGHTNWNHTAMGKTQQLLLLPLKSPGNTFFLSCFGKDTFLMLLLICIVNIQLSELEKHRWLCLQWGPNYSSILYVGMQVSTHGTMAGPMNSHHCPARASHFAFIRVFQLLAPLREMLFSIKTSPLLLQP